MVIDELPVLIVDSTILGYDIIFGADFLDKCSFHLDHDKNLVHWIEYDITLHDTTEKILTVLFLSIHTKMKLNLRTTALGRPMPTTLPHTSLIANMNRPTSTILPLTNIISCWISERSL